MATALALLLLAIPALLALVIAQEKEKGEQRTWRQTGEQLGLKFNVSSSVRSLTGVIGGYAVRIRFEKLGRQGNAELRLTTTGIPHGLSLTSEGGWKSLRKIVKGQDILTGDDEFDRLVHVEGREAVALAALDARARALVRCFVQGWQGAQGEISGGQLAWQSSDSLAKPGALTQLLKDAVATAESLQLQQGQALARLALNASQDPIAAVRLRNLEVLGRAAPGSDLALSSLRAALNDADGSLRAFAAANLGEQDLPRLLELAATDPDSTVRAKVIRHLASFAGSALWPAIDRAIRKRDLHLKRAAVFAAGATGYAEFAPKLAPCAESEDAPLAQAVAEALQQLGASDNEPTLIKLLGHESIAVRTAAAQALGTLGTVVAVEALLAETTGPLKDATLKRAASQAIASIQSRLGPVEMGRLSVVEPAPLEGALSAAEDEQTEGGLSLIHEESSGIPRKLP